MPVSVGCPNCNRKLRIEDDLVGKKVRCPDCKTIFVGDPEQWQEATAITTAQGGQPSSSPVEEEPAYEEVSPKKKRRGADDEDDEEGEGGSRAKKLTKAQMRAGWRGMRLALRFNLWGLNTFVTVLAVLFISVILWIVLSLVAMKSGSIGLAGVVFLFMVLIWIACGVAALVAYVLTAIGHGLFWQVPNQPGTKLRPMAIATIVLWFASLVLNCSGYGGACVCGGYDDRIAIPVYFCTGLLAYVAVFSWFFLYWIFIRMVCAAVGRPDVGGQPLYFMIVFPVYNFVVPLILIVLTLLGAVGVWTVALRDPYAAMNSGGALFIVVLFGWLVFWIIDWCLLLWSSVILQNVRKAVEQKQEQLRR